MADYGQYQTRRLLAHSALCAVWLAVPKAGGKPQYAIKVCEPSLGMDSSQKRKTIKQFEESVDAQQAAASYGKASQSCWAPIHESGRQDDKAFYVTQCYDLSLAQVFTNGLTLRPWTIHQTVKSILEGLHALEATRHRPHANLKPSNVMIAGRLGGRRWRVVLSDPLPASLLTPAMDVQHDLRTVGGLLYQLVHHRPPAAPHMVAQETDDDWAVFGRHGPAWRQLCHDLLNANPSQGLTINDALSRMHPLRSGAAGRRYGVAASIALLLAGGIGVGYSQGWHQQATVIWDANPSEDVCRGGVWEHVAPFREQLCTEWHQEDQTRFPAILQEMYRHGFSDFIRTMNAPSARDTLLGRAMQHDPAMLALVKQLNQAAVTLDIDLGQRDMNIQSFERLILGQWLMLSLEKWVSDQPGDRHGQAMVLWLEKQGMTQDAAELRRLIKPTSAQEQQHASSIWRRVNQTLELSKEDSKIGQRLDDVMSQWQAVDAAIRKLNAPTALPTSMTPQAYQAFVSRYVLGERVPFSEGTLDDWAGYQLAQAKAAQGRAAELDQLTQALAAWAPAGARGKVIDWSMAPPPPEQPTHPEAYRQWIDSLGGFARFDTSVYLERISRARQQAQARLRDLTELQRRLGDEAFTPGKPDVAAFTRQMHEIETRFATAMPAIESRREAYMDQADEQAKAWDRLSRAIMQRHEELDLPVDPQAWLASINQAPSPHGSPAAARAWQSVRQAWLRDVTGDSLKARPDDFRTLRTHVEKLRQVEQWKTFDLPAPGPDIARLDQSWQSHARSMRQRLWADSLSRTIADVNDWPASAEQVLILLDTLASRSRTSLTQWEQRFVRMADQVMQTSQQLDQHVPFTAVQLRQMASGLQQSAGQDEAMQALIASPIDRLQRHLHIASATDRGALLALVRDGDHQRLEWQLAIWRRLGALTSPAWPADAQQLAQDIELARKLKPLVQGLPQASSAQAAEGSPLIQEINHASRDRWERCLLLAATVDQLQAIIALAPQAGVDATTPLQGRTRFNLLRDALERDLAREMDDASWLARLEMFVTSLKQIDNFAPAQTLAASLTQAMQQGTGQPSAVAGDGQSQGPGASWLPETLRWTLEGQELTADGQTPVLHYQWRDHHLTFIQVTPANQPPAFICTTELPVGLAMEILEQGRHWSSWLPLLHRIRKGAAEGGPFTWQPVPGEGAEATAIALPRRGRVRDSWLLPYHYAELQGQTFYEQGMSLGPEADHPLQNLSAAAAIYLAQAMGCRLPTAAEWQAASAGPQSRTAVNLRDKAWSRGMQRLQNLPAPTSVFRASSRIGLKADQGVFLKGSDHNETTSTDDGHLWFAPVGQGRTQFEHLTGNVAEWVYDAPQHWAITDLQALGQLDHRSLLRNHWDQLAVIGGSALGSPSASHATPLEVARSSSDELDDIKGYADVGMRLAFTPPTQSIRRRLLAVVHAMGTEGYLVAPADQR